MKISPLQAKREMLKALAIETDFKKLKTINRIAVKAKNYPNAIFDNLLDIISDTGILYQAMGNIQGKSGALTPGTNLDPRTAYESSSQLIQELSVSLKKGTFRFKPIRRVYMDKSGKNPVTEDQRKELVKLHQQGKVTMDEIKQLKARPLGIPSFPDKIVQEAIRMVLTAIYDPEFAKVNTNFGFRAGLGCQDAIYQIQCFAKTMDYAIEGDIKGAFDNVCHDILIQILRKKIKDEGLLKLIKGGLKCGIIFLNYRQDSEIGTTQGSVLSPLLYNIYFHEFDFFIKTEFNSMVEEINKSENRKDRPVNKLYNSYSKRKTTLRLKARLDEYNKLLKQLGYGHERTKSAAKRLQETLQKYKEVDKLQKKTPAFAKSRQTIRFWYTRYADDWVFFTNASLEQVTEWKQLFIEWIQENLKLTVSVEKTRLTDLRRNEYVKFLGYQLSRQTNKNKRITNVGIFKTYRKSILKRTEKVKEKILNNKKLTYKIRATNPTLIVSWDRDRVLNRLINNGFVDKVASTWRGRSKMAWTALSEPEIIERFNYIIRGYLNYYCPVDHYTGDIQFLIYLLKYSCAHTLAHKRKVTLRKIFTKYGKNIKIKYIEKVEKVDREGNKNTQEREKSIQLLSWDDCKEIMEKILVDTRRKQKEKRSISAIDKAVDEICNVKVNWRTKYKLSQHCAVCGSDNHVEYHHVKQIKVGKVTGFLQVMKQLNRKQIPCCRECHRKIHRGQYDGMALKDIYDEELIIL